MTILGFIIIFIIAICLPFYIVYAIYIRRGTGIKWFEGYFLCPNCQFKIGENMYYKTEILNEWYTYETKKGNPDLRYKDNPLCRETKYYWICKNCNHSYDDIYTDYDMEEDEE